MRDRRWQRWNSLIAKIVGIPPQRAKSGLAGDPGIAKNCKLIKGEADLRAEPAATGADIGKEEQNRRRFGAQRQKVYRSDARPVWRRAACNRSRNNPKGAKLSSGLER